MKQETVLTNLIYINLAANQWPFLYLPCLPVVMTDSSIITCPNDIKLVPGIFSVLLTSLLATAVARQIPLSSY